MLKSAIQSQLDGVKTGLTQLSTALKDIQEIKQKYKTISFVFLLTYSLIFIGIL